MSEPTTPLERAQHIAHLLGGNGLSQNQQVALVAAELERWSKRDHEVWANTRELLDDMASGL